VPRDVEDELFLIRGVWLLLFIDCCWVPAGVVTMRTPVTINAWIGWSLVSASNTKLNEYL